MMQKRISVIVPVFNISKYLKRCIDSLLNQTLNNIEIILVDDGSNDNSGEICDYYYNKYPDSIKVLHTENCGLSAARNRGLEVSTGEYISFVDGDDWIEPEFFETLYELIKLEDYDLSVCGIKYDYNEGADKLKKTKLHNTINQTELFNLMINDINILGYVCNKLFKSELIDGLKFDEELFSSEDIDFCSKYAQKCKKIIYTSSELYHYRQRIGSMTGEFSYSFRKLSVLRTYERLIPIYESFCPQQKNQIEKFILKQCLNILGRMKISKYSDNDIKQMLKKKINYYWDIVMYNSKIPVFEKINILITRIEPGLMLKIKQIVIKRKYQ